MRVLLHRSARLNPGVREAKASVQALYFLLLVVQVGGFERNSLAGITFVLLRLVLCGCDGDHLRAAEPRHLHRIRPHRACGAMHPYPVARLNLRAVHQSLPRGERSDRHRRRFRMAQPLRLPRHG